ncbi:hypothetical protein ACLOJK_021384 [Asimina triloba]
MEELVVLQEMSIELSLEDVKKVAFQYGFEMEMGKTIETTYTANLQSMMQGTALRGLGLGEIWNSGDEEIPTQNSDPLFYVM